ncbi:hypothetical protein Q4485_03690 [Granulosicoccaceae sp. 1_MG-2023]|nr:hypothetical protein [Granulosicoccaceae sp. 1_MG-2023]
MQYLARPYPAVGLIALLLSACSLEPDDPDLPVNMCYDISGDTLSVRCVDSDIGTCYDYNASTLASYDDYDSCAADTDQVLDNWAENGTLQAGSNANGSSSSGTGSSGDSDTGTYSYSFTCSGTGERYTVDVPDDSCSAHSEYFAEVYGCNLVDEMGQACRGYYGCLGQDTSACP